MSRFEDARRTAAEERAREAVRCLPQPPASPHFRLALKERFVAGEVPAAPDLREVRPVRRRLLGLPRPVGIAVLPLAAAAVLILVLGLLNRGPAWRIADSTAHGTLLVDGEPVALDSPGAAERVLRPGRRIAAGETGAVTLVCPERLVLRIPPGGEITLPRPPGRWFGRTVRCALTRGSVGISSGPEFTGARLLVATEDADVEVLGTTLAVILIPEGTCICVLDGVVRAAPKHGAGTAVPAGRRCTVFHDDRPPTLEEIDEAERETLLRIDSF
ncbi:MAG: hypothetical protein GF346_00270 [Candidatus Eisenbacteria bacterium]|nr:hypothetical protein [Candidatus Latescibacterota bacterium]MBD3300867.1 hypothetical protein [Candidatus Eisenbacteria bacterium]